MNSTEPRAADHLLERIPLLVWLALLAVCLLIPLKIAGYGFLPPDDALRHAAKVISGKPWSDIMVMRPGIDIDHSAGWHGILSVLHRATGWNADGLVSWSVIALCSLFLVVPMFFFRRPEAWTAALLATVACAPTMAYRLCLGRPYVLVMTIMVIILALWSRSSSRPSTALLIGTTLLFSLAAWVHGGWYNYWLPAAALVLLQDWRSALRMGACWAAGSVLAGLYTGRPWFFLTQQFEVLVSCFGHHVLQRTLVGEFQPAENQGMLGLLAGLILLLRSQAGLPPRPALIQISLALALISWVLGFYVRRFTLDWALPALVFWVAIQLQDIAEKLIPHRSLSRLFATGLAAAGLYFGCTADLNGRWTSNLTKEYLRMDNPEQAEWLPEPGGILYSDSMVIFYDTFFANPRAPWKYAMGFESTFMTPENLEVYRRIQWNYRAAEAYAPWVEKLAGPDRLVVRNSGSAPPAIPGLEWKYAATETWIGRRPRGHAVRGQAPRP